MEFEKEEFDGLMLPVHTIAHDVDIVEKFPELKKYVEFKNTIPEKNKVVRYIAYLYDRATPLVRIDNVMARKAEAARLAMFEMNDNKFSEYVEEMLSCNNVLINSMIVRYLRLNNNHKFAMLSTTIEIFYRNLQDQLDGKDVNFKTVQLMEKEISRMTQELVQGDNNQNLTQDLYQLIDLEKLELAPEDIAERIAQGLPGISYNPYK